MAGTTVTRPGTSLSLSAPLGEGTVITVMR
jgi:hypothetical protein